MGGGGGDKLEITGAQKKDPVTQARERELWNQAKAYAAEQPFSSRYGDASAMPGMGQMSQAGQKYLTDAILGPGQYQAQSLGFTDYQSPADMPAPINLEVPPYAFVNEKEILIGMDDATQTV